MEGQEESLLTGYPEMISYGCTKKILNQMEKYICKIKIDKIKKDKIETEYGTGFFCKIPFPDEKNILPVFVTNNHVIEEEYLYKNNETIEIYFEEDNKTKILNLNNRKKYTNKEYDVTIIEIIEEDQINNYLELDDIIIDDILGGDDKINKYKDKTLYIIQYPKGDLSVSYGILQSISVDKNYKFNHKCCTEVGSSGSPILNLNNKVMGVHHRGYSNKFNEGTFLNYPIKEFIEINYNKNIE